ncbi:MAG: SpoIIIAH-like family protein [Lachnospiraceae bacterium]|nr:SpoIIIAH-like family protein [Lachnospiraceae bacterium]
MFKRNQVMITALAIMIAVAGYLNFAGTKIEEEELVSADAAVSDGELTALLDLSQEDIAADIYSLDPAGEELAVENFLDEDMQLLDTSRISVASELVDEEEAEGLTDTGMDVSVQDAEVLDGETPGEAVYTSSAGLSVLSGARLLKEQTRAKNKETLLEIINNANIPEAQKQEAVTDMIELTQRAERESAAEILLEAKGFESAVVTITEDTADVVVGLQTLTDAQCAQIEDIVARKTGIAAYNIVINPLTGQ